MSVSITQTEIENGLISLGVKAGMMLEVHCSLGSFGQVDGGALTIINTLKNIVGIGGAILMPSFKLSLNLPLNEIDKDLGLSLKIKILHDDSEKSAMGIVADTFRQMPDVVTGDGIFCVSAWGLDAEKHASMGFQHLIDSEGYALLMGVDIYSMSTMHYVEDDMPNEIKDKFKPSKEARSIYPKSDWFIESWKPTARPWYIIQDRAYKKGYVKDTFIGNSKCMLIQVKNTIELYRQALQNEPFELYGLT
jgi:aminoglycoside N3'-acetyltransferase